jgi:hypothetical protein
MTTRSTAKVLPLFGDATPPTTARGRAVSDKDSLLVGLAGEHMVCADLLLAGYRAFPTSQCCHFDVAVETALGLLRLQVKTTLKPKRLTEAAKSPAYWWHIKRRGRDLRLVYDPGDFDLLALVAIDNRKIAYLPPPGNINTICFRSHNDPGSQQTNRWGGRPQGKRGRVFGEHTFALALEALRRLREATQ